MRVSRTDVLDSLSTYLPDTDVASLLEAAAIQAGLPKCDAYAPDELSAIAQAILMLAGRELGEEADASPVVPAMPTLS